MALFKIVFSLLLLAAAEECDNSERDEVQLLQAQDKGREIQPDWTKIVDAAKTAVNSGIGKVTTQLSDALDTANTKILAAGTKFNQSVEKFESKANANFTVSQNLSAFKSLIDANVKQFVPSYNTTLKQVTTGLATTKTVMGAMGQKELAEKLEKLEGTVTDNLRALADSTQAMAQDMTQATADNYGDYFATMKKKLQFISSTSASFKSTFESQLEAFSGALLGPLEDANDV
ncbi:unnamed protein product [Durusdinium trenchii]|uniref:Uncharacterized protein n=1 Tax=Durusdinium trenchii TaxID=1381693 RepID=A0ABP0KS01_9DINO